MSDQVSVPCAGCGVLQQIPTNSLSIPVCRECRKNAHLNQQCVHCHQNHGGKLRTHESNCPARFPCRHCGTVFPNHASLSFHQCSALPDCHWCDKKDSFGHHCNPSAFHCCCGQQIPTASVGEHIPQCEEAADFWRVVLEMWNEEEAKTHLHNYINHPRDFPEGPVPAPYFLPNRQ